MAVITEAELRSRTLGGSIRTLTLPRGAVLTPDARIFAREKNLVLEEAGAAAHAPMPVDRSMKRGEYVVESTGEELNEKPEDMTHLHANVLVPKDHPRIRFRGKLDSLQAEIIGLQCAAAEAGRPWLLEALSELLAFARTLLACEVKEEPFPRIRLFGLDDAALRARSHDPQTFFGVPHLLPDYTMGRIPVALNRLRTQVREAELSAADAFPPGGAHERRDLIRALNRMSSAVYILFCRSLSKEGETHD